MVKAIVHSLPGGRVCAAEHLGLRLKKFDNQAYENNGSRPLTDEQLHQLECLSGTSFLPQFVASLYGGMFVPMNNPETLDNTELYSLSIKTSALRGKVDQIIAKALADGVIEHDEEDEILCEHTRHLSARHEEILAVVQLHREPE
ncbi:hypothetical protein D3C77_198880 [compost metagenome]